MCVKYLCLKHTVSLEQLYYTSNGSNNKPIELKAIKSDLEKNELKVEYVEIVNIKKGE